MKQDLNPSSSRDPVLEPMRDDAERRERETRHQAAVAAILAERAAGTARPQVTEAQIRQAREQGRP